MRYFVCRISIFESSADNYGVFDSFNDAEKKARELSGITTPIDWTFDIPHLQNDKEIYFLVKE